jgi:hypothetical protein
MSLFPPTDLIIPVWGAQYTQLLLQYTLPSLFSEKNLPAWADKVPSRLVFYACEEAHSAILTYLKRQVFPAPLEVVFRTLPPEPLAQPTAIQRYYRASLAYQAGINQACREQRAVLPLTPDLILSADSLSQLLHSLAQGAEAVFIVGLRLAFETVAARLEDWRRGDTLPISSAHLVQLLQADMHDSLRFSFLSAERFIERPSFSAEWLSENSFAVRAFHLHPFYLKQPLAYRQADLESYFPTLDGRYLDQYARVSTAGLKIIQDTSIMAVSFGFSEHPPVQTLIASGLERERLIHAFSCKYCEPIHRWFYEHPIVFEA